jgi:hypothetical protein
MSALDIIHDLQVRGFTLSLTNEGKVRVAPADRLTDDDRHVIRCYKSELLWRLRHPEGDPDASGYCVPVFIEGARFAIPLDRLIAEGREIVQRENLRPKTEGVDPDLWAATVALGRYDEAHRQWAEARL